MGIRRRSTAPEFICTLAPRCFMTREKSSRTPRSLRGASAGGTPLFLNLSLFFFFWPRTHQPQANPRFPEGGAAAEQPDDEHHGRHAEDDDGGQQRVLVLQEVVVAPVGVHHVAPDIAEASRRRLKGNVRN